MTLLLVAEFGVGANHTGEYQNNSKMLAIHDQCQKSRKMSKTFIGGAVCREFESEAPAAEEMLD